jgi:2-polyprenyl-3-methyl-5-hydroxy-6-metoxy-1,4-benzoquinol methylase
VTRWSDLVGDDAGREYAERFERIAAAGGDVHGEAACCARLVPPGSRVLDAGCGTGRVAVRLAELGYDVVGVDLDASMLAEARRVRPDLTWLAADLATLDLAAAGWPGPYDLVVAAGNVLPLLAMGTEAATVERFAAHARPDGGLVVAGFGLDAAHLPPGAALLDLAEYDRWCAAAGLRLRDRWSTWDGAAYADDAGYAVSVHERR